MKHTKTFAAAILVVSGLSLSAAEYTATTTATKWSGIAAGEWSPSEFVSDTASTGTVNATGASFAFDTAITAAKVALVAGADMSVTMPTTPTAGEIVLDGSSHLVTFASELPGRKVCCRGDVKISSLAPTTGLVLDILDGTTTFSGSGKLVVENKSITFNVRGGTLQNASGLQIYTGFTGGSHQYFNVCGGKMTSRLAIANNKAQGTHVSVTAGEFAPTAINYSDGSSAATEYQRDCVPIALSGGTFSVPSTLPVWAPVTVSGTAGAIRSDTPGGSKVYSRITIPEGASLSLVPGQGGLTILTDVAGTGTLVVDGGCLRPADTNRFEGAIRFVAGKKLVFDTSLLSGDEGAILAEGGFVFPEGKTIADIAEFVTLPNPYTFGLEVGEDGKSLFARRTGSVDYTVSTASSTWSGIADGEWQPHVFFDDKGSTVRITTSASTFSVDGAPTVGELRIQSGGTAITSVSFPGTVTCDHIVLDGADGKVALSSLPRNLEFDGTVEISSGTPATSASALTVVGGTTTLTASRVNIENKTFTINVKGGLLETKSGDIYTGHRGDQVRTYNISGGKFACLLTVPNKDAYLRNTVNVSGGEFAPKGIKYSNGGEGGEEYVNDIFAINLSGGVFSVPAQLPRWAPVVVSGDASIRAQSAAIVSPPVTIADGATLSFAADCGRMTFKRDFLGGGTLAVDHDVTWVLIATNRLSGALRFASGAKLTIDTANLPSEGGAIVAEGGLVFPEGKSAADIAEFVAVSNPNGYRFSLEDGGKAIVVTTLGPVAYAAHSAATSWSAVSDADWSPVPFVSDSQSTVDFFTQAGAFSFDTAIICAVLQFVNEGEGNCDVTFPTAPNAGSLILNGSNGTLTVKSAFPSSVPMQFRGDVSVNVEMVASAGCSRMDVLDGTTTLVGGGSRVNVENVGFTMNVYGGLLQNKSGVYIYTGFTGDNHQYFNVYGGRMTSRLGIANHMARGTHVNVYGGEFAPTSIDAVRESDVDWRTAYNGVAIPIRLMGGVFSVPDALPAWAETTVVSNSTIRAQGNATVYSKIAVEDGATLTIAPSVSGGTLTLAADVTGAGTVRAETDVAFRLAGTGVIATPFVLAEGATLTIDTSVFSGEDGELTFPAGFTPPPGKTAADVADFVKLSNPFGYEYEASSDLGRFTVRSRGAISFVAETQAAAWSQIADEEWSPMPFQPDSKNLVEVRAAGEAFAFDTAFISDTLRFACNRAEGCSVSFGKTPAVNALTIDGSNGLVTVTSALPAISPVRLCGDTALSVYQPGSAGCKAIDILGGTTTLNGANGMVHIENIPFTINVRGGLLQNKSGVYIYTGFRGDAHQYFNVYGGKVTSWLGIANHLARGSHVNVYGGEFAPTAINTVAEPAGGDWRTNYNGTAVSIMLMGGVFSVPDELPAWAETTVESNSTIRAQGSASVYSEVKVEEDATLTVADSENGGLLTLLNDVTGTGTLALDGDLAVRPGISIEGKLRFRAGHALLFAADATTVTNAQLTVQGGFEFDGCEQKDLSRLVRFTDPHLHGYVPIIRGKVLRMAKQGLCIYVR